MVNGEEARVPQLFDTASRQRPPLDVCCYTFRLFWSISRHLGWPLIDTGLHCESLGWYETRRPINWTSLCPVGNRTRERFLGWNVQLEQSKMWGWKWAFCTLHLAIKHPIIIIKLFDLFEDLHSTLVAKNKQTIKPKAFLLCNSGGNRGVTSVLSVRTPHGVNHSCRSFPWNSSSHSAPSLFVTLPASAELPRWNNGSGLLFWLLWQVYAKKKRAIVVFN